MHIPKGPTAGLELALFEPALQAALQPSPDYDAARWLYVPNTYSEYRYILGTRGKKPLICVGINPSTAAPDALDPTLQSAQRIALANGYDSFLPCASRATFLSFRAAKISAPNRSSRFENSTSNAMIFYLLSQAWCYPLSGNTKSF